MPALDHVASERLDLWWRTTKKAINQWLDAPDDRLTRPLFLTGDDLGGPEALADAVGALAGAWSLSGAWPVTDGSVHDPDSTAIATWAIPADVLALPVPRDAARVDVLLDTHPDAWVAWGWWPWVDAVRGLLDAEPDGQRADLDALLDDRPTADGLRLNDTATEALEDLIDSVTLTPADVATVLWCLRHETLFDRGLDRDPRVVVVPLAEPSSALASLVDRIGLVGTPLPTLAPPTVGEAPQVSPRLSAHADAVQKRLAAIRVG